MKLKTSSPQTNYFEVLRLQGKAGKTNANVVEFKLTKDKKQCNKFHTKIIFVKKKFLKKELVFLFLVSIAPTPTTTTTATTAATTATSTTAATAEAVGESSTSAF